MRKQKNGSRQSSADFVKPPRSQADNKRRERKSEKRDQTMEVRPGRGPATKRKRKQQLESDSDSEEKRRDGDSDDDGAKDIQKSVREGLRWVTAHLSNVRLFFLVQLIVYSNNKTQETWV